MLLAEIGHFDGRRSKRSQLLGKRVEFLAVSNLQPRKRGLPFLSLLGQVFVILGTKLLDSLEVLALRDRNWADRASSAAESWLERS